MAEPLEKLSGLGERISDQIFESFADYINYLKHLKAYQEACRLFEGKSIVDLGCGTGYGTVLLADSASEVLGLDINEDLIAVINQEVSKSNLRFEVFNGAKLPLPDASLDGLVSLQVIEHVPDVTAYLREIHRVLRPGGKVLFTSPNRRVRLLPLQKPWNPYHLREYTFEQFNNVLLDFFSEASGYSLQATAEIASLDLARTRQQPLDVYLIRPLKNLIKTVLPFLKKQSPPVPSTVISAEEKARFSVDQFDYVQTNDPSALDLLFIAIK